MTPSPTCCHPGHTVVEVAEIMKREDVGLVPVVDESSSKLMGVLTDRDIVMKVVADGRDPRGTAVSEVMTTDPCSCREQDSVETVMQQMAAHQVRRSPHARAYPGNRYSRRESRFNSPPLLAFRE